MNFQAPKYHETSGLPLHYDGNEWRVLGTLRPHALCALPNFSDSFGVIPESNWQEISLRNTKVKILNQSTHSSCTGNGSVVGFSYAWLLSGQTYHDFSATYIYAQINGGRDQGAMVSDALTALKTYGTCFMSEVGEDIVLRNQIPATANETAKRFKVFEAYKINNFEELGSAIQRGLVVVSGFAVGNNFSQISSEGVAPLPNSVAGGHCTAQIGMKKSSSGDWIIESQNSWGNWALGGYYYMQRGAWNPMYGFPFDAFAIGGVLDDPQDTDTDVPVLNE